LISPRLLLSGTMPYLYHYTSSEGIEGIRSDGVIRSSTNTTIDAIMGKGVYLTSLDPSTKVDDLLHNNWDDGRKIYEIRLKDLEYFIRFNSDDLPKARRSPDSRNIWLVPHDIVLNEVPHYVARRDKPHEQLNTGSDSWCLII
jgi:hypothetical protein